MTETQQKLLVLLSNLDSVCKKHGVTYYLEGGSALGAVRNHGFLPWDDDLDVCMTRNEFQKLLAAQKDIHEMGLDLVCHELYPDYHKSTVKLTDLSSTNIFYSHIIHGYACGQHIDIFILDPVPAGKTEEFLAYFSVYAELLSYYYVVNKAIDSYRTLYYEYLERCKKVGRQQVLKELEEKLFCYTEEESDYYFFRWGDKQYFLEKSIFEGQKPVYLPFEDLFCPVAPQPAAFLRGEFGDSWRLVPEEKEQEHHDTCINYQLSSNNVIGDFQRFIDKEQVITAYKQRKILTIDQIQYQKAIEHKKAKIKAVLIKEKLYAKLKRTDYQLLLKQKKYTEVSQIFSPFYHMEKIFVETHIIPDIDETLLKDMLYIQIITGFFYEALPMLELLQYQNGERFEFVRLIALALKTRRVVSATEDGDWRIVSSELTDMDEIVNHVDFLCAYLTLQLRNKDSPLCSEIWEIVKNGLICFSDNGDLMKIYADMLLSQGKIQQAYEYYRKAVNHTRNGLTLLELKEKHGIER